MKIFTYFIFKINYFDKNDRLTLDSHSIPRAQINIITNMEMTPTKRMKSSTSSKGLY